MPDEALESSTSMEDALNATLLFHSGGPWTEEKQAQWVEITGRTEATSKVLCDHIRWVLSLHNE